MPYAEGVPELHQQVREIDLLPRRERPERVRALVAEYAPGEVQGKGVAWSMIGLVRDVLGPADTVGYIVGLPTALRQDRDIEEQLYLAQAKGGEPAAAAAALETLIDSHGGTPERYGLLGGRYKQTVAGGGGGRRRDGRRPLSRRRHHRLQPWHERRPQPVLLLVQPGPAVSGQGPSRRSGPGCRPRAPRTTGPPS